MMLRAACVVTVLVSLAGCQLGYYAHLARGHLALMGDTRPVESLLADPATGADLRARLQLAAAALAFAEQELGLEAGDAYRDYVDLERDYVVWNLVAAPAFSLTPEQWCYPVAGCASYRGFFDRARADRLRASLEARGLDVYGSGAIAYSTLGWFDDPLTSAMLGGSPAWTVELLFHELVHRRLYVKGDTRFNESLATAVAREGRRRWLARQEGQSETMESRQRHDRAAARVDAWVDDARQRLQALYDSELPADEKRAGKARVQAWLRDTYAQALAQDDSLAPWRDWFDGPLNNAQLALREDYLGDVAAFEKMILDCGGNMACFWESADRLAAMPAEPRRQWLEDQQQ